MATKAWRSLLARPWRWLLLLSLLTPLFGDPAAQASPPSETAATTAFRENADDSPEIRSQVPFSHTVVSDVATEYLAGGEWMPAETAWRFPGWPSVDGADWIWTTELVTPDDARDGSEILTFRREFALPQDASGLTGVIHINADNAYEVALNGEVLGSDGVLDVQGTDFGWTTIESFAITPTAGLNVFTIRALNYRDSAGRADPYQNPAGVVFRADIQGVGTIGPKRPVILIPGMGASLSTSCFVTELLCGSQHVGIGRWGWTPTAGNYYSTLIREFQVADRTERNGYFSIFFYDWRKPLAESVDDLKARIDALKAQTGQDAVDLIGHSMGGLVGRAYVQGPDYGGDVAHLVTLGSPHQGTPKAYPYWQAGMYYQVGYWERRGFDIVLRRYIDPLNRLPPVWVMRATIPGWQDILPTFEYLRDEANGGVYKPLSSLTAASQNQYLAAMNAPGQLTVLFERTDVTTIAGNLVTAPYAAPRQFLVRDRPLFPWPVNANGWPNWDDGLPAWTSSADFGTPAGDGTIWIESALLPTPAQRHVVDNVGHGALPNDSQVIGIIFGTLQIPRPSGVVMAESASVAAVPPLVLAVNGPADLLVTDTIGQWVGPSGATIPGAEYASDPGGSFVMVYIPEPMPGGYSVQLQGNGTGDYALSLLAAEPMPAEIVGDPLGDWDTAQSMISTGATLTFAISDTLPLSSTLLAVTPLIKAPALVHAASVEGRSWPGTTVQIRDADTQALLGSGQAGAVGDFGVGVSTPLRLGQRIYPVAGGQAGLPVTVTGWQLYLPLARR
jgi:pimeloyl-ACP methyl ester carboxylesterase